MDKLTENEKLAKAHFMNIIAKANTIPIHENGLQFELEKPNWFDEKKYELGRKFFHENREGILMSNLTGLVVLLCVPSGLRILYETGKSGNKMTARKRYIDTILHTLSWYDFPLDSTEKSWESLKRVRRMHASASLACQKKAGVGAITQREVSLTTFGFAGLALIRPQFYAINKTDPELREGFLHFWAVLNFMLGVHDEFNFCLLPMEAAEIEMELIMRELSVFVQVETPLFKEMANALIDGMKAFIVGLEYESLMFSVRRVMGVSGYQYRVDVNREIPIRRLFCEEDHEAFDDPFLRVLNVMTVEVVDKTEFNNNDNDKTECVKYSVVEYLHKELGLNAHQTLKIEYYPEDGDNCDFRNDREFSKLSYNNRLRVALHVIGTSFIAGWGSGLVKRVLDHKLDQMRHYKEG